MNKREKIYRALSLALKWADEECNEAIEWNFGYVGNDPHANYWVDVVHTIEDSLEKLNYNGEK